MWSAEEFEKLEAEARREFGLVGGKVDAEDLRREFDNIFREWMDHQQCGLNCYRPTASQLEFHESPAKERILIGSNRSGKTLASCAELAMVVTGRNLNGVPFPKKNGIVLIAGLDLFHLSTTIWRNLTMPGAFHAIWDKNELCLRPVKPDDEKDRLRRAEWIPSPPFLPRHWFKSIAWENRAQGIPRMATIRENDCELRLYSSKGEPPQGFRVDYAWFDEEMEHEQWYKEVVRGMTDNPNARFVWSATPQVSSPDLFDLHMRGIDRSNPHVSEHFLHIQNNPHIAEADKQWFRSTLRTPEQVSVRWDGQFQMHSRKVYPEFREDLHVIDPFPIPVEWRRDLALDPGYQTAAVVFIAISPEGMIHVYDELYIKYATAKIVAEQVAMVIGPYQFQRFLIDYRMGRQTQMTDGRSYEWHYSEAFREKRISSVETGHGFAWGSDNVPSREESLRRWLDGRIKFHRGKTPNLLYEFGEQFYQKNSAGLVTNKRMGVRDHAVTCLEYLAASNPAYIPPPKGRKRKNPLERRKKFWRDIRRAAGEDDKFVSLS
jgi:hypothetical protein